MNIVDNHNIRRMTRDELIIELIRCRKEMKVISDFLKPNWSNDMEWSDEILISIRQRDIERDIEREKAKEERAKDGALVMELRYRIKELEERKIRDDVLFKEVDKYIHELKLKGSKA